MKRYTHILIAIVCSLVIVAGCKKPYKPVVIANNASYLVVEGVINSGPDSTIIKLSRTIPLSSTSAPEPVVNAQVAIESEQGSNTPLYALGSGRYGSGPLNLEAGVKYRLSIKTPEGQEYQSDFVENKITPDIDSITYRVQNNGLQLYVNAHDPQNNTRYYRWDFVETWKYVSFYYSTWKYENGAPVYRLPNLTPSDNIFECYKTESSHQILVGSTAKLSQDVLSMQPVDFIEAGSGKISFGYSILLKQYALTPEAFSYWQLLKKNTESLGSIFDAQPSSLPGNIHNISNADEPVIGYVSVCSIKSKRIFIDHYNIDLFVPFYLAPPDAGACPLNEIAIEPAQTFDERFEQTLGSGDMILVSSVTTPPPAPPVIVGYTYALKECVDCKAKAPFGTNVKPSFWP